MMGKKFNPEYRKQVACRLTYPSCHYCKRRGQGLVWYKDKVFHKVCIERWESLLAERESEAEALRSLERERHLSIKDWWKVSDKEREELREQMAEAEVFC